MDGDTIKILCIDKNNADLAMLQNALNHASRSEFELVQAVDLEHAVNSIAHQHFDIILIDLPLLDRHGYDVLGQIYMQAPNIPIIVLTDTDSEAQAMRAVQAGVQDYLVKSHINGDRLLWKLRYAVEHRMRVVFQQHLEELQLSEARFHRVMMRNADGIIVVDRSGIVCMVNPAAESLIGRSAEEVVGHEFGFPVVVGETTELDILRPGSETAVAEMRVVEIDWDDSTAFLMSLRDITQHRKLQEALRNAEQFSRSILNSITAHIVVLNEHGIIIAVNDAWVEFLKQHGDPALEFGGIGESYIIMCERGIGPCLMESVTVLDGVRAVLRGKQSLFVHEYPCYTPQQAETWFVIRVMPLVHENQRGAVVSHTDITARRLADRAAAQAEAQAMRVVQLERELEGLLQMAQTGPSAVTSGLFGKDPLRKSAPYLFEELVRRYGELLDLALDERAYKVEYDLSGELRLIANRLGFLKAGPRDVVEIHSSVLKQKSSENNPQKDQAYLEEGRLLVLELMGYLVSYYRYYAL